jgi:uncharacterized protein YbaA (DUF1428 family)
MSYVTVMVLPVPKARIAAYRTLVRKSAKAWKKAGALAYHELIADDVKPGKLTSFPQSLHLKKSETVGCAYIVFKSKAHADKCWKLMMKDPFMANFDVKTAPFDGSRMFWGGFKTLTQF